MRFHTSRIEVVAERDQERQPGEGEEPRALKSSRECSDERYLRPRPHSRLRVCRYLSTLPLRFGIRAGIVRWAIPSRARSPARARFLV